MKKLIATAALFAALASPAIAHGLRVPVEAGFLRERSVETARHRPGHHYGWQHKRLRGCRVTTRRIVLPNGAVEVHRVRRCG